MNICLNFLLLPYELMLGIVCQYSLSLSLTFFGVSACTELKKNASASLGKTLRLKGIVIQLLLLGFSDTMITMMGFFSESFLKSRIEIFDNLHVVILPQVIHNKSLVI